MKKNIITKKIKNSWKYHQKILSDGRRPYMKLKFKFGEAKVEFQNFQLRRHVNRDLFTSTLSGPRAIDLELAPPNSRAHGNDTRTFAPHNNGLECC